MRILPALALLTLTALACRPATDGSVLVPGTAAERIDAYLDSLVPTGFSGVAAVASAEGPILIAGYGLADDSTGAPVTPETVFGIGSITKQFTAAAILRLEMDSLVSVRDSIGRYFDGVPPDKASITLHHLLTHSAGFPGAIGDDYEEIGRSDFVARALETDLEFEPGSGYAYSNVGYSLLAAVVETVSGESYEAYLRRVLFEPAGMYRTGYVLPDFAPAEVAVGYRGDRRWGRLNERAWAADGPWWNLRGNGGILSTAGDMLLWDRALKGDRILSREAREKLYARHVPESPGGGSWYGYGWVTWPTPRGTKLVSHNGSNGIFFADFLRYLDEDVTVFVATNRSTRAAVRLGWTVADLVFDPDMDVPAPTWRAGAVDDFPDTPAGRAARRVVGLLTSGAPEDLGVLVDSMMVDDFRDMVSREDHLRILGSMQQDLAGRTVGGIRTDGRMFEITLERPGEDLLNLSIETEPGDPARLAGLGLDGP